MKNKNQIGCELDESDIFLEGEGGEEGGRMKVGWGKGQDEGRGKGGWW